MNIEQACEHFKQLILQQQKRLENLEKVKKDYSKIESVTIGLVDGDGIGPIIMNQAVRVLEKLLDNEIKAGTIILKRIRGLTIERRIE